MPAAPECKLSHHGRIMKCVTFLLLLPETLKKLKRANKHPGRLSACYNVLTLSLKKRMAAELYPANDHATVPKNGTVMLSLSEKKRNVEPVAQTATTIVTTPTTEQNINNNNVEIPSWQSAHPTLRERQVKNTRSATLCGNVLLLLTFTLLFTICILLITFVRINYIFVEMHSCSITNTWQTFISLLVHPVSPRGFRRTR